MDINLWLTYAVASAIILVVPGPTIILVISQAMTHGRKSVIPLVAGVLLGDLTAMTLSLLGLGALMSASAALFGACKWIGVAYLVYLGVRLWRSNPQGQPARHIARASPRSLARSSFVVTALNPKGIAFFVAFLPQFIDPAKPAAMQLLLLGGTFLVLAGLNASLYAVFAGRLGEYLRRKVVRRWFNRLGGGALIGAGIITAGVQRTG